MLDRAEQRVLDETARRLRAEDPGLAARLARRPVGGRLSRLVLVCLGVLAVGLLFLGLVGQAFVLAAMAAAWWAHQRYRAGWEPRDDTRSSPHSGR